MRLSFRLIVILGVMLSLSTSIQPVLANRKSPELFTYSQTAGTALVQDNQDDHNQTDSLWFENISTEQGLSQSTVTAILQDRQGFMWFGTEGGLNKYDGYQFSIFKHDPDNPQSLSANGISSLFEDRDGTLWIGTSTGLDRMDRSTGNFVHYPLGNTEAEGLRGRFILTIFQDQSGTLWVGTEGGGLVAADLKTDRVTIYKHNPKDPKSISDDTVHSVYEGHDGKLWIGTDLGLDRYDPGTSSFAHDLPSSSGSQTVGSTPVYAFYEDGQSTLWIGTKNGLLQWNRAQNQLIESVIIRSNVYSEILKVHYGLEPEAGLISSMKYSNDLSPTCTLLMTRTA